MKALIKKNCRADVLSGQVVDITPESFRILLKRGEVEKAPAPKKRTTKKKEEE